MGFHLQCFLVACEDEVEASRILQAGLARFRHTKGRRFREPFAGVIVGLHAQDVLERYQADPSAFDFADEEEAYDCIMGGLEDHLAEFSRQFPQRTFGYVNVDCFGGMCLFHGFAVQDGIQMMRVADSNHEGHLQILKAMGTAHNDWHFEPFTRGFLEGGSTDGPIRRAIMGKLIGFVRGVDTRTLVMALAVGLKPPWKVCQMDQTLLVEHGEQDVWFSLNPTETGTLELSGQYHAPHDRAIALMKDFLDAGPDTLDGPCRVEVRRLDGTVVAVMGSRETQTRNRI